MEIRDVSPGLWIWRPHYPDRHGGNGWEGPVNSVVVESRGEIAVIEPLRPHEDEDAFWERLDANPPTMIVILKPDHVRDVDLFAERYGVPAYGPWLFWGGDAPKTDLEPLEPDLELPGGFVALYDARWRVETPLWLPEQRAIVFEPSRVVAPSASVCSSRTSPAWSATPTTTTVIAAAPVANAVADSVASPAADSRVRSAARNQT